MRRINNLVASALVGAAGLSSAHAADPRYPIAYVQTVKITPLRTEVHGRTKIFWTATTSC